MLTTFDPEDYVYAALRAGASGFLLKDAPADQLVEAIEVVARGDAQLAPQVTRLLIEEVAKRPQADAGSHPWLDALTDRETEVLRLMSRGRSNVEIATDLFLGEATIKTHVGRVLAKLGARDRVQAVVMAYETVSSSRASPDPAISVIGAHRRATTVRDGSDPTPGLHRRQRFDANASGTSGEGHR